jgi:phosphoribosylformimino-5-aminoimidazole carboxamide ribotide isomerase
LLIIPAIDLIDGRTVRLTQGDYAQKTDYGLEPADVARDFEQQGAEWLHVVDLDGAKSGQPVNLRVLESIANATSLKIEFGGGVRTAAAVRSALSAGASRVVMGSKLAKDLAFAATVFAEFGERIVAGIDTREGNVAVSGWTETSEARGIDLAGALVDSGCRRIIWTDIARDGGLTGPNLTGLRLMISAVCVPVIASGGVGTLADILALTEMRPAVEGVIVGKALYEGRFTLRDAIAATRSVVL